MARHVPCVPLIDISGSVCWRLQGISRCQDVTGMGYITGSCSLTPAGGCSCSCSTAWLLQGGRWLLQGGGGYYRGVGGYYRGVGGYYRGAVVTTGGSGGYYRGVGGYYRGVGGYYRGGGGYYRGVGGYYRGGRWLLRGGGLYVPYTCYIQKWNDFVGCSWKILGSENENVPCLKRIWKHSRSEIILGLIRI